MHTMHTQLNQKFNYADVYVQIYRVIVMNKPLVCISEVLSVTKATAQVHVTKLT